jgi:hypothetical protein
VGAGKHSLYQHAGKGEMRSGGWDFQFPLSIADVKDFWIVTFMFACVN